MFFVVLSTQSQAYDCYFDKLKPGVTKKALEEINIFAYGPDTSNIFTKQLYVEEICKGDPEDPPAVPPSSQLKHQCVLAPYQLQLYA